MNLLVNNPTLACEWFICMLVISVLLLIIYDGIWFLCVDVYHINSVGFWVVFCSLKLFFFIRSSILASKEYMYSFEYICAFILAYKYILDWKDVSVDMSIWSQTWGLKFGSYHSHKRRTSTAGSKERRIIRTFWMPD